MAKLYHKTMDGTVKFKVILVGNDKVLMLGWLLCSVLNQF